MIPVNNYQENLKRYNDLQNTKPSLSLPLLKTAAIIGIVALAAIAAGAIVSTPLAFAVLATLTPISCGVLFHLAEQEGAEKHQAKLDEAKQTLTNDHQTISDLLKHLTAPNTDLCTLRQIWAQEKNLKDLQVKLRAVLN